MTLTKLEQSGFIIQTDSGFRLAIDIGNKTSIESLAGVTVDAVIVSHIHGDHFSVPQIKQLNPKIVYLNRECRELLDEESISFEVREITTGQTIQVDSISIDIFHVDHGPNVSVPLKENFGFLIRSDAKTIYFAGDMFYPSGIDVAALEVDFALIPVGTHYTFGPSEAFAFSKAFKMIGTLIPMHYENKPETRGEFIGLVNGIFKLA